MHLRAASDRVRVLHPLTEAMRFGYLGFVDLGMQQTAQGFGHQRLAFVRSQVMNVLVERSRGALEHLQRDRRYDVRLFRYPLRTDDRLRAERCDLKEG